MQAGGLVPRVLFFHMLGKVFPLLSVFCASSLPLLSRLPPSRPIPSPRLPVSHGIMATHTAGCFCRRERERQSQLLERSEEEGKKNNPLMSQFVCVEAADFFKADTLPLIFNNFATWEAMIGFCFARMIQSGYWLDDLHRGWCAVVHESTRKTLFPLNSSTHVTCKHSKLLQVNNRWALKLRLCFHYTLNVEICQLMSRFRELWCFQVGDCL